MPRSLGPSDRSDGATPTPLDLETQHELSSDLVELIDQSATIALAHASELQARLRSLAQTAGPGFEAAKEQVHQLLVDIVSLRNAAELLKRELEQAV